MAIFQEVISYYVSSGSNVYTMLLDCSKAFDRVSYQVLFPKLLERGLCPLWAKLYWNIYQQNVLNVRWAGEHGRNFQMRNGVKQGGIASPKLFTLLY